MTSETPAFQQAIFGDLKGAHTLIASSVRADERLLSDLASRYTDRLLPAELPWKEYSCGFPLHDYYVVTRTFPVKATRAGMVQTHAMMVPLANVHAYGLRNLLALLPTEPRTLLPSLDARTITEWKEGNDANVSTIPPGYPSIICALLHGLVPVWVGQEGFEDIVCFLWQNLWPEARRNLRFRVSAEPNDLADFPATLVWTPKALRANWNDQHFVNQASTTVDSPSMSEEYLMSMAGGDGLGSLLGLLQVPPKTIPELRRLEQYVTMSEGETADRIRVAVRLLSAIAPGEDELQGEKKSLLDRLAQKTADGTEEDVLALRNLDVSGIESGPITIQNSIANWLRLRIDECSNASKFASEVLLVNHPWRATALAAILHEFDLWTPQHAKLLWHWWMAEPALVAASDALLPRDRAQNDLVATIPSIIDRELREQVLSFAVTHSWLLLHGAVISVASEMTAIEKFKRQLDVEPLEGDEGGLHLLVGKLGEVELVEAAIELHDDRLADFAGQAAARSPALLANLDVTNATWLTVWSKSIQYGGRPFSGIVEPSLTAHLVMDALIGGSIVPQELVERLVIESESDLAGYEGRARLWEFLPYAVREVALRTTARTWLTRFFADSSYDHDSLESELEEAIIETWRNSRELASASNIPALWARFAGSLGEHDFLAWLGVHTKPLTSFESVAIGSLVTKYQWQDGAASLVRLFRNGRNDVVPAVNECVSLLSFWDKVYVSIFSTPTVITLDEWWSVWVDLSSTLYPWGVSDNNIWSDADGDLSRIERGSGRREWSYALDLLRKGGAGGTMTIEGLLHEMRKDFPGNSNLELLETIYLRKLRP